MVAPVVLVIGVIIGYPLVRGIYLSLTDANERNVERTIGVNHIPATYEFVGLDNYAGGPHRRAFLDRFGWTLVWTVACVPSPSCLGLALANMLNRGSRGRTFYRMALILPWAVPAFVSVFAWRLPLQRGQRHPQQDAGPVAASTRSRGSTTPPGPSSRSSPSTSGSACRS